MWSGLSMNSSKSTKPCGRGFPWSAQRALSHLVAAYRVKLKYHQAAVLAFQVRIARYIHRIQYCTSKYGVVLYIVNNVAVLYVKIQKIRRIMLGWLSKYSLSLVVLVSVWCFLTRSLIRCLVILYTYCLSIQYCSNVNATYMYNSLQ